MLMRGGQRLTILNSIIREGSMENVIFYQTLEESEGVIDMDIWGRVFQVEGIATFPK